MPCFVSTAGCMVRKADMSSQNLQKLHGCRNWKNALSNLANHNLSESHLFAIDRETILHTDFFVPLLNAVLSSIKTRFSKQATEFMTRITAFSPENWEKKTTKK